MAEKKNAKAPPSGKETIDFLVAEYNVLASLYSHAQSAIQSLFNFYLTIISATIGAIILVFQRTQPKTGFGILSGLLIFATLIGIFHQGGIIIKYADAIHYAKSINELKEHLVNLMPATSPVIYDIPSSNQMPSTVNRTRIDKWETRLWWLFPIDVHQLFIGFVNSVCLASLILIPLFFANLLTTKFWQGTGTSFTVFWLSIIANNMYAKVKLRHELAKRNIKSKI